MATETVDGKPSGPSGVYPDIREALQNITELRAVVATARADKLLVLVEDVGDPYRFDAEGTGADDGDLIIVPTDVTPPALGRWFRIPSASGAVAPHALGGIGHTGDTLAHLNTKVSDATLDTASDPRTPNVHGASHKDSGADELDVEEFASAGAAGAIATSDGAGAVSMKPHDPTKWFDAASLDSPDGTPDVPGSMGAAAIASDSVNSNISSRVFPDSVVTGVLLGSGIVVPVGATHMRFSCRGHAKVAPGASAQVLLRFRHRQNKHNLARGGWSNAIAYVVPIPTNTFEQYRMVYGSFAVWGLIAGGDFQILFSRDPLNASDTLVNDFELRQIGVEFS